MGADGLVLYEDNPGMARVYDKAFFNDSLCSVQDAQISITSSAALYGLSVYTVFTVCITEPGRAAFRLDDHYRRLTQSARMMGIDTFGLHWSRERFSDAMKALVGANNPSEDTFIRASVHVTEVLPGTRSRGMKTTFSAFMYEAIPILPKGGVRLKTSVWRRTPDSAIPSRAKVNGAYVNSVLGKQDAIDSGYDDCIFLDGNGHVCELSAANIFIVLEGKLLTPDTASDILEGITRKTILELSRSMGITAFERPIDLTELYIADEVFACGTSANITPTLEIDARKVALGTIGAITKRLQERYSNLLHGNDPEFAHFLSLVG